jgi:selenocysteine-specific elongation factor
MRAAINLVGVPLEEVKRGQELAKPGYLKASKVLSVQLLALKDQRHPIKHRTEARLHIGTAEVMVTVSLLNAELLNPGQSGLAQLFLKESVTAIWGQPFVLRNSSAETTLGGGQVLQPTGLKIRRSQPEMLQWMDRLRSNDIMERAEAVVWFRNYHGLSRVDLVREAGIAPSQLAEVENSLIKNGKWLSIEQTEQRILLHRERWNELEERILAVLAKLHSEAPLLSHHDRQKVISQLAYIGDEGLIDWGIEELIRLKKISGDNRRIACSDFKPKLSQNQKKLKDRIVESLRTAGFAPPEPRSFANLAGGNAESLEDIFAVAVAEGLLVRVSHEIYLHADAEASMREAVRQVLASGRGITVAEIRDILGTTRKFAVPLCEYLDRIGFTHREGDLRFLQVANS